MKLNLPCDTCPCQEHIHTTAKNTYQGTSGTVRGCCADNATHSNWPSLVPECDYTYYKSGWQKSWQPACLQSSESGRMACCLELQPTRLGGCGPAAHCAQSGLLSSIWRYGKTLGDLQLGAPVSACARSL